MTLDVARLEGPSDAECAQVDAIARAALAHENFALTDELARPWMRLWVARSEGAIAGFLLAWHVADELHVLDVATAPERRRRGVATAVLDAALEYARAERIRILLLEVRRSNVAAIGLYRKRGFVASRVRSKYYADNDEDAVEMILAFDPASGAVIPVADALEPG